MRIEPEDILNQSGQQESLTDQDDALDQPQLNNPWLATAGSLMNDPFFEEYIAEINQYRYDLDQFMSD
jgi:hypothetical protein